MQSPRQSTVCCPACRRISSPEGPRCPAFRRHWRNNGSCLRTGATRFFAADEQRVSAPRILCRAAVNPAAILAVTLCARHFRGTVRCHRRKHHVHERREFASIETGAP
jgi:hypothetical protein